ncbi:MAG: hypothetical protein J5493_07210 [Lachnospiraceae bacterium]|nr:hypothetical protein [Lachnospiraceae bacterium]
MEERGKPKFGIHEAVGESIEKMLSGSGAAPKKGGNPPVPETPLQEKMAPQGPALENAAPQGNAPQPPASGGGNQKHDEKESPKKSSHTTGKAAGAVLLLALLGGGLGFGLGGRSNGGQGGSETTPPAVTQEATGQPTEAPTEIPDTPAPTQETTAAEEGVLTVTVRENGIEYNGRTLTVAELEQALLTDYKEGDKIRLMDDHAIKAVYDEVTALLDKLKMPVETAIP